MNKNLQESSLSEFENYHQQKSIASKTTRIMAALTDFFIYFTIGLILGHFYGEPMEEAIGFELNGIPALFMFGVGFLLWPISEGLWGQTLGKRIFGIKVYKEDYTDMDIGSGFIRYFMGYIDMIFLIGIIVAYNSPKNQRIGDAAAKTIVLNTK
jgi:uncharacterized RDD family membrane protein YckC